METRAVKIGSYYLGGLFEFFILGEVLEAASSTGEEWLRVWSSKVKGGQGCHSTSLYRDLRR